MKTSTIIFNFAAVVVCFAVLLAVVDLMRHKTMTYGVTPQPTKAPAPLPTPPANVDPYAANPYATPTEPPFI